MQVLAWLKSLPQASAIIARVQALFAAADFDFSALTAEGVADDALAKLITQRAESRAAEMTKNLQIDRDDALSAHAAVTADLAAAKASLASAHTAHASIIAALEKTGIKIDATASDLGAAAAEAIATRITSAATERLAESGVPAANLPAQVLEESAKPDRAQLIKAFNAITDPKARGEFYLKNSAAMFGEKSAA